MFPSRMLYRAAPGSDGVTVMNACSTGLSISVIRALRLIIICFPRLSWKSSISVRSILGASLTGLIRIVTVWSENCSPSLARKVTTDSPLTSSSTVMKLRVTPLAVSTSSMLRASGLV